MGTIIPRSKRFWLVQTLWCLGLAVVVTAGIALLGLWQPVVDPDVQTDLRHQLAERLELQRGEDVQLAEHGNSTRRYASGRMSGRYVFRLGTATDQPPKLVYVSWEQQPGSRVEIISIRVEQ